jgi:tetratricopeptide (TPR) repeat protein
MGAVTAEQQGSRGSRALPAGSARRGRIVSALTVALAAVALSHLATLLHAVPERLGPEPSIMACALAGALLAAALAARGSARARWLVGIPVGVTFFAPALGALARLSAAIAGPLANAQSDLVPRTICALMGGAVLGALLGRGAAALAGSRDETPDPRARGRARARGRLNLAFGAAAFVAALVPESRPLGVALGAAVLGAWLLERQPSPATLWHELLAGASWAVGLAGVVALAPIAARLVAVEGRAPWLVAFAAALGLALGARARRLAPLSRAAPLALASPLVALGAVYGAPGPLALAAVTGLAALLAGVAFRPDALPLALAALLGAGLEGALLHVAELTWTAERKLELAHAPGCELQSFAFSTQGIVAVVDSKAVNVRGLIRDGVLLGSVAIAKGETRADVKTPVLASVLVELLGRSGGHIACLGLGDGIAAHTLGLASGLTDLWLVEPDPGIRAIPEDPGDLFHHAWGEHYAKLVPLDAGTFLRRASELDAIVDLEGGLTDGNVLERARGRLVEGAVLVRILRDGRTFREEAREFAHAFPTALVFRAPNATTAILLGGVASIDSRRSLAPGLQAQLSVARIDQDDLLGTWTGGARSLRAATCVADLLPTAEDVATIASLLGDKDALVAIGDSAIRLQNGPRARAIIAGARALGVAPAELDRAEGDLLFREGHEKEAVALFEKARAEDPSAVSPRLSLAARHLARRQLDEAQKLLEGALVKDARKDAPVHFLLGGIAWERRDYKLAQGEFEAARGYPGADDYAAKAAEIVKAVGGEKPSVHVAPEQKDPERLLEEARLLVDDAARREAELRAGLPRGVKPGDEQLELFRLSREEARSLLEIAVGKEPGRADLHFELGHVKRILRDLRGSISEFEIASRLAPDDAKALYALGDVLRAAGDNERALEAYERGLDRGPLTYGKSEVYLACADILVSEKRWGDAAHKLEEAERLQLGNPEVEVNLGAIYERLGRTEDAARAYHRYLDLVGEGGDPQVKRSVLKALERLRG